MTGPVDEGDCNVVAPRARPYATTAGRTEGKEQLDIAALVRATGRFQPRQFPVEHAAALALCSSPVSVAEVAANLAQPVVVAKVLLSDLVESGAVAARPLSFAPPDLDMLEKLLNGLQKL